MAAVLGIEDFGTGRASLAALKRFPIARLRIDKSFIDDLETNESVRAVTTSMISLGQKLNLRVIAKGVETETEAAFLREYDRDEIKVTYSVDLSRPTRQPGYACPECSILDG